MLTALKNTCAGCGSSPPKSARSEARSTDLTVALEPRRRRAYNLFGRQLGHSSRRGSTRAHSPFARRKVIGDGLRSPSAFLPCRPATEGRAARAGVAAGPTRSSASERVTGYGEFPDGVAPPPRAEDAGGRRSRPGGPPPRAVLHPGPSNATSGTRGRRAFGESRGRPAPPKSASELAPEMQSNDSAPGILDHCGARVAPPASCRCARDVASHRRLCRPAPAA